MYRYRPCWREWLISWYLHHRTTHTSYLVFLFTVWSYWLNPDSRVTSFLYYIFVTMYKEISSMILLVMAFDQHILHVWYFLCDGHMHVFLSKLVASHSGYTYFWWILMISLLFTLLFCLKVYFWWENDLSVGTPYPCHYLQWRDWMLFDQSIIVLFRWQFLSHSSVGFSLNSWPWCSIFVGTDWKCDKK